MAPSAKLNLKDKVEDGELDLSMSALQEVPIKEIAQAKKANKLDLSNNRLTSLGKNFATLTHIIHLDLSNNMLKELPENFGNLKQLKHLDLYNNKLTHLPLSFSQLKSLKWLDLKNNPLVPALAQVAGPCLDAQQCQKSAKNVVDFLSKMQDKVYDDIVKKSAATNNANKTKEAENAKQQKQKEKAKKDKNKKDKQEKNDKKANTTDNKNKQNAATDKSAAANKQKKNKAGKKNKKQSFTASVIKKLFTLIFIACVTLPILSYVYIEHIKTNSPEYRKIRDHTSHAWNVTVSKMPPEVLHYAEVVSVYTAPITEFVTTKSVIIFEMIGEARQSEQYKLLKVQVQTLLETLVSKIKELFNSSTTSTK